MHNRLTRFPTGLPGLQIKNPMPEENPVIIQRSIFGPEILPLLCIVFIVLKLTGNIDWSWWWITAPVWIPIAMVVGLGAFLLLVLAIIFFGVILVIWIIDKFE